MKKISYILIILGIIFITSSLLLLKLQNNNNSNNNNDDNEIIEEENTIPWTTEFLKEDISNKDYQKYNAESYKIINISRFNNLYHIIPEDAYLKRIIDNCTEYSNDKIYIYRYNSVVDKNEISSIIDSAKSLSNSKVMFKYELEEGNVLLLEKRIDNGVYNERLYLFIKAFQDHYHRLYYSVENMSFSNSFINEIINMNKYKSDYNNLINKDDKWIMSLNAKDKKVFELNYDSSKYHKYVYYHDYNVFPLKIDENSDNVINLFFYYDNLGVDEEVSTTLTIKDSKKIKINDYDSILYTTIEENTGEEYNDYIIFIDDYTKIRVNFPKSIEDKVDINDFLNFVYK